MIDIKKTWDAGMHETRSQPQDVLFNQLGDVVFGASSLDDSLSALANIAGEVMAATLKVAADELPSRHGAEDILKTLHEVLIAKFVEAMNKRTVAAVD
jgi:hypothetical protein